LIQCGKEAKQKMHEEKRKHKESAKEGQNGKRRPQGMAREQICAICSSRDKKKTRLSSEAQDNHQEAANNDACKGKDEEVVREADMTKQIRELHNICKIVKDKVYKKVMFVQTQEKKMAAARKVAKEYCKIKSGAMMTHRQTRLMDMFVDRKYNAVATIINALQNEVTTNLKCKIMGTLCRCCELIAFVQIDSNNDWKSFVLFGLQFY